jgi:hypothetical protein
MNQCEKIGVVAARIAGIAFIIQGLFDGLSLGIISVRAPGQIASSTLMWVWPLMVMAAGTIMFAMAKSIGHFLASDLD